jgi:hypothetical protein
MENLTEELIRGRLTVEGYYLLLVSVDAAKFFENAEAECSTTLDYTDRRNLMVITRNCEEKVSKLNYNSKPARLVVAGFSALGQRKLLDRYIRTDEFISYVMDAFKEYCSMKRIEEDLAAGIEKLSLDRSDIGHALRETPIWFRILYDHDMKNDSVRLKSSLKNIIRPKV